MSQVGLEGHLYLSLDGSSWYSQNSGCDTLTLGCFKICHGKNCSVVCQCNDLFDRLLVCGR